MDNICHTLVGAAMGEAGLKRRTRFGNAALMISANLPDLDVLVFATDTLPVSFRRGWTHGVLAQLLLPAALTALFVVVDRVRQRSGAHREGRSAASGGPPLDAGWLMLLAYAGVYSHVLLDFLNNYGIRLLAPFDWRWFYGDAVFIVDPVLWVGAGAGVWLARRYQSARPARTSLVFAACYVVVMLVSAGVAREHVRDAWRTARGAEPRALMVGPQPLTLFSRQVIVDAGDRYETGVFTWRRTGVTFSPEGIWKGSHRPEVAAAIETSEEVRAFLVWSRFPYWTVEPAGDGARVTLRDMRFAGRGGFTVTVTVPTAAR